MSTNKFVQKNNKKDKDFGQGTKFHELVTKVSVGKNDSSTAIFQEILKWVKGNRYLRIIQRKDKWYVKCIILDRCYMFPENSI